MATYGRSFRLADPAINGVGARKAETPPRAGQYTKESGFFAYYEVRPLTLLHINDQLLNLVSNGLGAIDVISLLLLSVAVAAAVAAAAVVEERSRK